MIGFRIHRSLLFEKRNADDARLDSGSIEVRECSSLLACDFPLEAMKAASVEFENFRRRAICFLAVAGGRIAGSGWLFRESRLLRRLGNFPGAVYLGGFHVPEEFRQRGIYTMLLRRMGNRALGQASAVIVQSAMENKPSIRGLKSAGFVRVGVLDALLFCGVVFWCNFKPGSRE